MGDAKRAIHALGEAGDQDGEEMANNVVSPVETSINNTSLPLTKERRVEDSQEEVKI